jgi:chemotaxis protein MotA
MSEFAKQFAAQLSAEGVRTGPRLNLSAITKLMPGSTNYNEKSRIWTAIGGTMVLFLVVSLISGTFLSIFDIPSLLLVLGGVAGATLVNHSSSDIVTAVQTIQALGTKASEPLLSRMQTFCMLATDVRKEGILVLEKFNMGVADPFLKRAIDLVVDRHPQDEIRRILEQDMLLQSQKMRTTIQVLNNMALYAPNMGLIGTLLGLVSLLSATTSGANIAPALAVALITTLYGSVLANIIFHPLAGRTSRTMAEEISLRTLTIEGALCLARQDSSVFVEQKLKGFIAL